MVRAAFLIAACTFSVAPSAHAAGVTLADPSPANASTCATGTASSTFLLFGTPFKVNNPAGAATGDLLVLTLEVSNDSNFLGNFALPDSQATRWTPLLTSGEIHTYYRIRASGDPSQYQLVNGVALVTASATLTASITAYTGADPAAPFANAGSQSTGTGLGAFTEPTAAVVRGGSMRYTAVATDASNTVNYSGAGAQTETCHVSGSSASVAGSSEPTLGPPSTPVNPLSLAGSSGPNWVAQTYVIQPPLTSCKSGGLNISTPSTVTFPPVTLNGLDQTVTTTAPVTVDDETGLQTGWSLSGTSTQFTSGAGTLPTNALSLLSVTPTAGGGNCSLPVNGILSGLTLPSGVIPPTALKLFNAALVTGSGLVNLGMMWHLAIPATARVGTYTSTWTLTVASGP